MLNGFESEGRLHFTQHRKQQLKPKYVGVELDPDADPFGGGPALVESDDELAADVQGVSRCDFLMAVGVVSFTDLAE